MDYVMHNSGTTTCPPGPSIVTLFGSIGYNGNEYANGDGVIYDIVFDSTGSSIEFKVNNVFSESSDLYVKTQKATSLGGFLYYDCEATKDQAPCLKPTDSVDNTFTAACIPGSNHAYVKLYFATGASEVLSVAGPEAVIPECCYPDVYPEDGTIGYVELTYTIDCSCPPTAETRKRLLRGSK
jgi:hypothetical protein